MAAKTRRYPGIRFFGSITGFIWDQGSTTTGAVGTTTTNIAEASIGDVVAVQPATPTTGIVYSGYVSAATVVTIIGQNVTSGTIDPASKTFTITVTRPQ